MGGSREMGNEHDIVSALKVLAIKLEMKLTHLRTKNIHYSKYSKIPTN